MFVDWSVYFFFLYIIFWIYRHGYQMFYIPRSTFHLWEQFLEIANSLLMEEFFFEIIFYLYTPLYIPYQHPFRIGFIYSWLQWIGTFDHISISFRNVQIFVSYVLRFLPIMYNTIWDRLIDHILVQSIIHLICLIWINRISNEIRERMSRKRNHVRRKHSTRIS